MARYLWVKDFAEPSYHPIRFDSQPCPTVLACPGDISASHHYITEDHMPETARPDVPPYRIPSMAEIASMRGTNGLTVVSTFSGCGGSCLGFEMAGYRVAWASEFVPAARDTYVLNHPDVQLDARDIRTVQASEILEAIGLGVGELDVFEGSPPCAAFSTAGKREAKWGKVSTYSDTEQRSDDLFFEYVRLLNDLQPRAFIAENVAGLVKGAAKGYFKLIHAAMVACGYVVEARVIDAQWLGVPQGRKRLIFQGVRQDLGKSPAWPSPLPYRYSIRDALPDIEAVAHETSGIMSTGPLDLDGPVNTFTTVPHHWKVSGPELEIRDPETGARIDLEGVAIGPAAAKLARGESSDQFFQVRRSDENLPSFTVTARGGGRGTAAPVHHSGRRKFSLAELRRLCGFPDDFELTGTFSQRWERLGRAVPPPMMRAIAEVVRDEVLA